MDFERQKPVTDEYREGYERLYGVQDERKEWEKENEVGRIAITTHNGEANGFMVISESDFDKGTVRYDFYENGCLILTEERVDG
jgi:hypothetical protein